MRTEPKKVYLRRRRPCWECSRSLSPAMTGPNRGRYVAVEVVVDGIPRLLHASCADWRGWEADREAWNEVDRERELAARSRP